MLKIWRHECAPITGQPKEMASYVPERPVSGRQTPVTRSFLSKLMRFPLEHTSVHTNHMTSRGS